MTLKEELIEVLTEMYRKGRDYEEHYRKDDEDRIKEIADNISKRYEEKV